MLCLNFSFSNVSLLEPKVKRRFMGVPFAFYGAWGKAFKSKRLMRNLGKAAEQNDGPADSFPIYFRKRPMKIWSNLDSNGADGIALPLVCLPNKFINFWFLFVLLFLANNKFINSWKSNLLINNIWELSVGLTGLSQSTEPEYWAKGLSRSAFGSECKRREKALNGTTGTKSTTMNIILKMISLSEINYLPRC